MAASRSLLESLLARVRERAQEERPGSSRRPSSRQAAVAINEPVTAPPPSLVSEPALALAGSSAEDEIEDYEDELIEILDDADDQPETASHSSALPLELSPSVPQVEMRRREVPPSQRQNRQAAAPVAAPAAPTPAAAPVAAAPVLQQERIERAPLPPMPVASTQGNRPEARSLPFVELLDASVKLGVKLGRR